MTSTALSRRQDLATSAQVSGPSLKPTQATSLQPPPSPTHIIQQFSLHSEFPGSHLVPCWGSSRGPCGSCSVAFCLAGTECIGNIDPQLSFLLKRKTTCWKTTQSSHFNSASISSGDYRHRELGVGNLAWPAKTTQFYQGGEMCY